MSEYVRDHLYERLMTPWVLPKEEWPLAKEDWQRVDAICALPWEGRLLDFGAGDGTLAAMVCSRNPKVTRVFAVETDLTQHTTFYTHFGRVWEEYDLGMCESAWPIQYSTTIPKVPTDDGMGWKEIVFDGALCCEVLEHLALADGILLLRQLRSVLRPGAMCCVTVPHRDRSRQHYPGHITSFDSILLTEIVREAGLKPYVEPWPYLDKLHWGLPWIWVVARA